MTLAPGLRLRPLEALRDRVMVTGLVLEAADYITMERGTPMSPDVAAAVTEDFFAGAPPGCDAAASLRVGLCGASGRLLGLAELAFGYPGKGDAYLGLIIMAPDARGSGIGRTFLAELEAAARARGAARLFLAVLDANTRGRAFWRRSGFAVQSCFRPVTLGPKTQFASRMAKPLFGNS